MENKKIENITFDHMREMVDVNLMNGRDVAYISGTFAMFRGKMYDFAGRLSAGIPYCMQDSRFGLIKNGSADFFVNLRQRHYERGTILFLKQGSILQLEHMSEDFELSGVTFGNNDLYLALNGRVPSSLQGYMDDIAVFATEEEASMFDRILHVMWDLFHEPGYNKEMMSGLLKAAVLYIDYLDNKHQATEHNGMSYGQEVFNRFIRLVNDYARKEHNIDFYAGRLCFTPRYFGTLIKKVSGHTPKEWIDRQLVTEAKVRLKHTDQQVARIADELGFPNTSFFCKYFRRIAGMSPQDYRQG